jgi:dTDP-4-amino-4,6-dideoxygalactose transaminase
MNFNLDVKKTIQFINQETFFKNNSTFNKKTKRKVAAIIVVHTFGNPCDIQNLIKVAKKKNIKIIEDAAESLGSFFHYKRKIIHTGSMGFAGCISFNVNKIITAGSGGMLITNSKKIYKKARHFSTQAKKDPIFFKHDKIGFNYSMPNMNAALGLSQFKNLKYNLNKKRKIFTLYKFFFSKTPSVKVIESNFGLSNYWLVVIKIETSKNLLPKIIKFLKRKKIQVRPVWHLLYKQKKYQKYQRYLINNVQNLVKNSLCLPSGVNLSFFDVKKVCLEINKFLKIYNC